MTRHAVRPIAELDADVACPTCAEPMTRALLVGGERPLDVVVTVGAVWVCWPCGSVRGRLAPPRAACEFVRP